MSDNGALKKMRVSVATLNRVLFPHPQDGTMMLALERKATALNGSTFHVRAQPFGGAVRILDPTRLREIIGDIQFDSERSKHEQDFRILIAPLKWESVKQYCLRHFEKPNDLELESLPDRELREEFEETLGVILKPEQYSIQPLGTVLENDPVPTDNAHGRGILTVRIYRMFEVQIVDVALCRRMLIISQRYSDQDLGVLALKDFQNSGEGRANSILTLPLGMVRKSYATFSPEMRYRKVVIESHELDENVLAILGDIDVPQYQRV